MVIPLRAGNEALILSWNLEELVASLPNTNVDLERIWAGLLTVVRDSWPDWPIEVWAVVDEVPHVPEVDSADDVPGSLFQLRFGIFFGGEGRTSKMAAAMASFVISGIARSVPMEPVAEWGGIAPHWKPLWVVDDEHVMRLYAPEPTLDRSIYLLGSYAGQPTWFAASEEAWPLQRAQEQIGISLADADVTWAFDL